MKASGRTEKRAAKDGPGAARTRLARRAWLLLADFAPVMKARWVAASAAFDLAPAQAFALRQLEPGRPVAMSSLADLMSCDASNVTGLVDKLEARGLVARQSDPADRRVKMLAVTAEGAALRARLEQSSTPPEAIAALSEGELEQLCALLTKLVEHAPDGSGE